MEYLNDLLPGHKIEIPVLTSLLGRKAKTSSRYIAREIKIFLGDARKDPALEIALLPYGVRRSCLISTYG